MGYRTLASTSAHTNTHFLSWARKTHAGLSGIEQWWQTEKANKHADKTSKQQVWSTTTAESRGSVIRGQPLESGVCFWEWMEQQCVSYLLSMEKSVRQTAHTLNLNRRCGCWDLCEVFSVAHLVCELSGHFYTHIHTDCVESGWELSFTDTVVNVYVSAVF